MADKSRENCIICQIVGGKIPSKKVYEDGLIMAVLDVNGANPGHCFVMPKNHYPIIEQVPDSEIGKMFQVSNKISTAIFEALGAQARSQGRGVLNIDAGTRPSTFFLARTKP